MGKDKNQRRVRGISITPEVEVLVASLCKKYPKHKAKEIRNIVIGEIYRRPSLYFPKGIPPSISIAIKQKNLEWPSLSKIQKLIAPVKAKLGEPSEEDEPWCMGTLDESSISPDAVLAVLKVWKLRLAREQRFTVREAKWAARLSKLAKDTEQLSTQANEYAYCEYLYELVGRPFDSILLDMFYMGIPINILPKVEEDEQKHMVEFVPEVVSEGLEGEPFDEIKEIGFLAIIASKEGIELSLAEAEKRKKEWEAYKKEAQNER